MKRPAALAPILALTACLAPTEPTGQVSIVVLNEAETVLNAIHVVRCGSGDWGDNRLSAGLAPGASSEVRVVNGCWDLRAQFGIEAVDLRGVELPARAAYTWTVIGGAGPVIGPGADWVAAPGPPNGLWGRAIAYGDGIWAAVASGIRARSIDGVTWTAQRALSDPEFDHTALAFGDGMFVATTQRGVATSIDAIHWTYQPIPAAKSLSAIAFGDGTWVAADDRSTTADSLGFAVSTDRGITWEYIALPLPAALPIGAPTAITWANGEFVAVGLAGLLGISADGRTWNLSPSFPENFPPNTHFRGIAQGNGRFLAFANIPTPSLFFSRDARSWIRVEPSPTAYHAIAFGDGVFVAVGGEGSIGTSASGGSWIEREWDGTADFLGVGFGQGSFVAVGLEFAVSQ